MIIVLSLFYANRIFGSFVICLVFAFIVLEGVRFSAMGAPWDSLNIFRLLCKCKFLGPPRDQGLKKTPFNADKKM